MDSRMSLRAKVLILIGTAAAVQLLVEGPAAAHVKWFSDFDFRDPPLSFTEILDTGFWIGLTVAVAVIGVLPAIDRWLDTHAIYVRVNDWLHERRSVSDPILRYLVAASLILAWGSEALLVPELAEPAGWVGWLQLGLAILLLIGRWNRIAGAGVLLLWLVGVFEYGALHMLDYLTYVGIAGFLALRTSDEAETRGLALPLLYATVGVSLIWAGFEKLVYPEWSFTVLDTRPILRLGLPADVFLELAAFVEISLGFLLIIGLLGRPLALVITGVFMTSTIIFGRVEVIGHTPLHAALIVFLLQGAGSVYPAPIAIHRNLRLRMAFAAVNMAVLTLAAGVIYTAAARSQFETAVAEQGPRPAPIEAGDTTPVVTSVQLTDTPAGTDITLDIAGFALTEPATVPGAEATADDPTTGYGILSIDGDVVARITGRQSPAWDDISGQTAILTLFTTNGRQLFEDGTPLRIRVDMEDQGG
ncbi:MAG: DoxX family membrane protein [Actinomycetota bacterium]